MSVKFCSDQRKAEPMNSLVELKANLAREPFRPFMIELASGRQILIEKETEILFPRRRPELVIAFTDDGLQHEFEGSAILSLIENI
jgi:hypothetical protein